MNRLLLVCLVLGLAACSTHPRKIDCEAHLVPINPPSTSVHNTSQVLP